MSITNITAAIAQEILEQTLPYPIQWPNASTETPNDTVWLRITFLDFPDEPVTFGSNGYNRCNGLMQVDVFSPKGKGRFEANAAVDAVKGFFKTGAVLEYNNQKVCIDSASVKPSTDEPDWYGMLILINFTAYIAR